MKKLVTNKLVWTLDHEKKRLAHIPFMGECTQTILNTTGHIGLSLSQLYEQHGVHRTAYDAFKTPRRHFWAF